jgi:predicted component of type VI protein secretion system
MSSEGLREAIAIEQKRLGHGERPRYRVTWAPATGGAVDVRIVELPIVHLFVPDTASVLDGARVLIARTLGVDPTAFDVVLSDDLPL